MFWTCIFNFQTWSISKYLSTWNYSSKRFYFKALQIPFAKQVTGLCPPFMLGNCIPCTDWATNSKIPTHTLSLLPQREITQATFQPQPRPSRSPIYITSQYAFSCSRNICARKASSSYTQHTTVQLGKENCNKNFHTDKRNRNYL